jgi:UDP-N-acetyl-D-galactosamine dehydrogenase
VIGAVHHDSYRDLSPDALGAMLNEGGTLADIKGMWRRHQLAPQLDYWTL